MMGLFYVAEMTKYAFPNLFSSFFPGDIYYLYTYTLTFKEVSICFKSVCME